MRPRDKKRELTDTDMERKKDWPRETGIGRHGRWTWRQGERKRYRDQETDTDMERKKD